VLGISILNSFELLFVLATGRASGLQNAFFSYHSGFFVKKIQAGVTGLTAKKMLMGF